MSYDYNGFKTNKIDRISKQGAIRFDQKTDTNFEIVIFNY